MGEEHYSRFICNYRGQTFLRNGLPPFHLSKDFKLKFCHFESSCYSIFKFLRSFLTSVYIMYPLGAISHECTNMPYDKTKHCALHPKSGFSFK